jgi:molybdopterin synthase catalytic subunit
MPPVRALARICRETIDVAGLAAEVGDASCGAIATFVGVVRAETRADGVRLEALDYSAYEAMAQAELQALSEAMLREFPIFAVRAVHRLGVMGIGESSVALVVSAGHRGAAFDACRELMERIKRDVPIFKREIWQGGERTWVDPV